MAYEQEPEAAAVSKEMAATPSPVEVGARGTIASLVSQEIEYFRRLQEDNLNTSHQKQGTRATEVASASRSSRNKSGTNGANLKKKVVAAGGFLPSICSAVDITETGHTGRIARIGYKNLRTDGKEFPRD
ncbi:uncharacterized protein [Typha latifolia]|uniref:uncharacterized protein n=1 Tax=Typha latifolia TaxID=4733 RepID=UPI003C2E7556